ncbi:MAG: OmpA family protein [Bacteroidota bacterium]
MQFINLRLMWLALVGAFVIFPASLNAQSGSTEAQLDKLLYKLDQGESIDNLEVNLRDINFKLNSAELDTASNAYLDKVVSFLIKVQNIELEISGHTDNSGPKSYNQSLSEDRAKSVEQYLVGAGIPSKRIRSQGFGQEQAIASNADAAGRALNRRVTFKVIKTAVVERIQTLLILQNGDTIGVQNVRFTERQVIYTNFSSDQEVSISREKVAWVIYPDGKRKEVSPTLAPRRELPPPSSTNKLGAISGIFEQSKAFVPAANLLWVDYQALSTGGERIYKTGNITPPLGINFERQLVHNLGVRASLGSHWWRETRPLAQAGGELFTEEFVYQYWTLGLGLSWHFAINERWDPYLGYMYSYRFARGACQCLAENANTRGGDFYLGTRFLLTPSFFLSAEIGQHATGTFKAGMGLDF